MRQNLMIGLAVAMLCGVVFVATLVSQYSGPADVSPGVGEAGPASLSVPLSFTADRLYYAPGDENITRRFFDGYVEVSSALVPAPFWFQNPHNEPVIVSVRGRSCTACTSARLATISATRIDRYSQATAMDLALGANSFVGLQSALAATGLMNDLQWQQLDFEKPEEGATVPPAESPDRPTWGILMLEVKVGAIGPQERFALIGTQLGNRPLVPQKFSVTLVGSPPFSLNQTAIPLGELPEGSGVRTSTVTAWSATRGFDRFPAPSVAVTPNDGFVQIGKPVPLTPNQLLSMEADLRNQKKPSPVLSGYQIPITISRRQSGKSASDGPIEPELGPFERTVQVAGPGNNVVGFQILGTVTGVVTLQGANQVDLRDFNGKLGVTNDTFTLVSDRAEVTLAIDSATSPRYLQVNLSPPAQFGATRKRWKMSVSVPPEACYGDIPRDAAIVLTGTAQGETFRIRLPVKGRGFRRGS